MRAVLEKIFGKFDPGVFYPYTIILIIGVVGMAVSPDTVKAIFDAITNFTIFKCGWLVQVVAIVTILTCLFLMFSSYGNIKLGAPEDKPEFTTFSWISMMFCAGFGMTMWMWCAGEIFYHMFGFDWLADEGIQGSPKSIVKSLQYVFMDNSFHGWSVYALGAVAIALPAYRLKLPLNLAGGLYGILGKKCYDSAWGRVADVLGALASVGAVATALGMGMALITSGIGKIFNMPDIGLTGQYIALFAMTAGFIFTAVIGIEKGMSRMSQVNIVFSFVIFAFIIVVGPSTYIFTVVTEALGEFAHTFFSLSLWGDSMNFVPVVNAAGDPVMLENGKQLMEWHNRGYMNWWLVFYIIWWVCFIPPCGGFLARISKGRTIREFMAGAVIVPCIMVFIFFGSWSAVAANLHFSNIVDLNAVVQNNFGSIIYVVLEQYPLATLSMTIVFLSVLMYGITTYDATSQYVAIQLSGGRIDTAPAMRILVGLTMGLLGFAAVVSGRLSVLKGLTIVLGGPFVLVLIAYLISVYRMVVMAKRGEMGPVD